MIKCNYCGRENSSDAAFCHECGTPLAPVDDGPEPLVDAEASDWILRAFRWALEQFRSDRFYKHAFLVTPTPEYFPVKAKDPHERAREIFECVRMHAGLQEWPCKLVAQKPDVNPVVNALIVIRNAPKEPGGTFSVSGGEEREVTITYDPKALQRPESLVAIFAHELSHYLGYTAKTPPPGGEKNLEHATDLLAVYLGFGIFLSNSAVHFQQFTGYNNQGWSSHTLGYLSEFELVYCLAVFCTLKEIDRKSAVAHLKGTLVPVYDNCLKDLQRKGPILKELRGVGSTVPQ